MRSTFTIGFIAHNEWELMQETIPHNIKQICDYTRQTYNIILLIDGAEKVQNKIEILEAASLWGIDEVRFRSRHRYALSGDPSNNAHFHLFTKQSRFLLTLEADVVLFNVGSNFDILTNLVDLFEKHKELTLATRMDDHDCWQWKLERLANYEFEEGVSSVNRLSSHFLVYQTDRFCQQIGDSWEKSHFYDDGEHWYNYEDFLSKKFGAPLGSGIAFLDRFPIRVYHCDRKQYPDSAYYVRDPKVKYEELLKRKREINLLTCNMF